MDRDLEKDVRFRNLEKKIGLFIAVAVIGLLAAGIFVGMEKGLFTPRYRVYFSVESGAGFSEGMPVKLLGFKIGRVKGLSLEDEARVRVCLEISKEFQKWIRRGSVARLNKESVLGVSYIEVSVGPANNALIEDKDEITFRKVGGVEELAQQVSPVLSEVKDLLKYLNDPEGDLKKSMGKIPLVLGQFKETSSHISTLAQEMKIAVREIKLAASDFRNLEGKAVPAIESARKAIGDVEQKVGPALERVTTVIENLEKASQRVPEIAEKVEGILGDAKKISGSLEGIGPKIDSTVGTAEGVLKDTQETVKGIKSSWPVNLMVPKKEETKLVPLDGSGKGK